ncbi:MAG TPA: hypothetical protein VEI07_08320 [Planctomycetaceae bacterium]|nr:hypothetical protein [Planctomycetaceae bacterium]
MKNTPSPNERTAATGTNHALPTSEVRRRVLAWRAIAKRSTNLKIVRKAEQLRQSDLLKKASVGLVDDGDDDVRARAERDPLDRWIGRGM